MPIHLAETRQQAFDEARQGAAAWLQEYFQDTLGRPLPPDTAPDDLIEVMSENGAWLVGTPDDAIATIERLRNISGGFGGLLGPGARVGAARKNSPQLRVAGALRHALLQRLARRHGAFQCLGPQRPRGTRRQTGRSHRKGPRSEFEGRQPAHQ